MENLRFVRWLRRLESLTEAPSGVQHLMFQDESLAFGFQGICTVFETPITVSEIYSLALESSVTKSQTLIGQKDPIYLPDDLSRPNLTTVMSLIKGPPPMCNQTK